MARVSDEVRARGEESGALEGAEIVPGTTAAENFSPQSPQNLLPGGVDCLAGWTNYGQLPSTFIAELETVRIL